MKGIYAYEIDAYNVYNKKGLLFEMEDRPTNAICLSTNNAKNEFISKDKSYMLEKNTVLYIPKGMSYRIETHESGMCALINFRGNLPVNDLFCQRVSEPEKNWKKFVEITQSETEYERLTKFYEMLDFIQKSEINSSHENEVKVQIEYMKHHFSESKLSNEKLASMTNVSEVYFRKIFTRTTGMSPHLYLQKLRINEAKNLLKQNNLSIERIAEACGYTSRYYFSAAFKKEVGISPAQFASQYRFM